MKKRKTPRSPFPLFLAIGGGLLLIAAAFLFVNQNASSTPTPLASSHEEETYPEIQRVPLEDAKVALDAGSAVFVDVRAAEAYAGGHIAGAINIPLAELETRLGELDPNQWIITYCTWPSEESSARAASILLENGFSNVTPILGGFEAWQNAGYPVEP